MLLAAFVFLACLALPVAAIVLLISARSRIQLLEREVELLRRDHRQLAQSLAARTVPPAAPPMPVPPPAPAAAAPTFPAPAPARPPALAPPPPAAPVAPAPPEPHRFTTESLIGGLWLQNVGSVLVLLGVFFLILWGYRTGHLGPGALVAAAVAAGVIVAWRGDRLARQVPMLGHALVGVGLGIVYLSLYLGHFVLLVLPTGVAYTSLAVVSLVALHLGRHYRVQVIEALAVLGAFTPFVAPILVGGGRTPVSPEGLLGYLALANLAVFALVLADGFSGLALESLALTTVTWLTATGHATWGGWTTAGLAVLFLGFGHAPLPGLARAPARDADPIDALVVVLSPYLFLVAAGSWITGLTAHGQGWFLLALAAVEAGAAAWIERRRGRRDVWYGLVGGAVLFLTAALERLVGSTLAPLAWTIEGVTLVAIGLGAGSAWLRALGALATALGVLASAAAVAGTLLAAPFDPRGGIPPLLTAQSLRGLLEIGLLFTGERLYRALAANLGRDETRAGRLAFGAAAHFVLFAWLGRFALRLATIQIAATHGALAPAAAPGHEPLAFFLGASIAAAAWMAQALGLVVRGLARGDGQERGIGYAAAFGACAAFFVALAMGTSGSVWTAGDLPAVHPAGLVQAAFLALAIGLAARLDRRRSALRAVETYASEAATLAVNFCALLWSAQQAGRLAHVLPAQGSVHVGAMATSAAWMVQAVLLVAIGWGRATGFLRWIGLSILGITLLKVLFVDLAQVGVFWRFIVAIGFGVVLMLVSYAYQRSQRRAPAPGDVPRA